MLSLETVKKAYSSERMALYSNMKEQLSYLTISSLLVTSVSTNLSQSDVLFLRHQTAYMVLL